MKIFLLLLSTSICWAQQPTFDEPFFAGEPRGVLRATADRLEILKPKEAKLMAEAARFRFLAGDVRKGEELLKFAELLDGKEGEVQRLIGRALLAAGRRPQALGAYEKVIMSESRSKTAVAQSTIDLAEAGMAKEAQRFGEAFAILDDSNWEVFISFGRAFLKAGNRKAAAPWFQRAVILKPGEEKVFLEIGRAYADTSPRK